MLSDRQSGRFGVFKVNLEAGEVRQQYNWLFNPILIGAPNAYGATT